MFLHNTYFKVVKYVSLCEFLQNLETLRNNLECEMGGLGHVMLYRCVDAT